MASIYDEVQCDLESYRNTYTMSPELWSKFDIQDLTEVDYSHWSALRLLNDAGSGFSEEVNQIPTDWGGIYVYAIEPGIIPGCGSYIMYIGMASKTPHENLRLRVKSYQKEIGPSFTRDRLHRMFQKWGPYVYVYYLPVNADRDTILELESRMIAVLVPPCNPEIRIKSVKHAVRAFT